MTPLDLANGLLRLFQAHAHQSLESALFLAIIHRGLLDAAGVKDTSQKVPAGTQREATDFLLGRNGRLYASLCNLEPSWYLKHVKTFLQLTTKEPHVPQQT
jgi:hypothetical protein